MAENLGSPEPEPATPSAPTEPVPLEVPLEEQISALPPLSYPGSDNQEFAKWADDRRRNRLRVEAMGGVLLIIGGIVGVLVTRATAFIVIAIFAVLALAAYEFLVNEFE